MYRILQSIGIETGAFSQLTRRYMQEDFNPRTPDLEGVRFVNSFKGLIADICWLVSRYFSYGATVEPAIWSAFRQSHRIIEREEGPNDGLVSVYSSMWGGETGYKGTLVGVSHLDLINWTNRLRWLIWELTGNKRKWDVYQYPTEW
jgi:triacylglycerol lipase